MPMVRVEITKGASKEQKKEIAKDITNSLVKVLDKDRDSIGINFVEFELFDWFKGSESVEDLRKK